MSKCDTCANLEEIFWEWNNAVYNDWMCRARARVKRCKYYKKTTGNEIK